MNHPNITPTRPGPHVLNRGQLPGVPVRPAPHPYQAGPPAGTPPIPVPHGMRRPGPPQDVRPWGPPPAMRPSVSGYPPSAPVMAPPPHAPAPLPLPMGSPPWQGDSIGGFGAAPPPLPAPPEVKPKRRRGRIIAAAIVVSVAAAGGVGAWMKFGMNGDEDAITATMRAFKSAVDSGDVAAVTAQMCAEEAASLDGLELPPGSPPDEGGDADEAPVVITDIVVKGAVAAGTVPDNTAKKVYFRKEGEQWKVCSAAKADFDSAA